MRTILGIDPGTEQSAYVLWDGAQVVYSHTVDNMSLLLMLRDYKLSQSNPILAIEKIASYGMAVGAETFETVFWSGRFMEAWVNRDISVCTIHRPTRNEIKNHICHSSKARDTNVRQALIDRFGVVGTVKTPGPLFGISKHKWAALAVAVFVFDTQEVQNEA